MGRSASPPSDVRAGAYTDAVTAVVRVASRFSEDDWRRPAVGHWSATEIARHLVGVVTWYHEWLDRALAGQYTSPFPTTRLAERNEEALESLGDLSATDAIARFETDATRYLERASAHADLPFGYPSGTVTVGLHLGVAATEWNLHAWDLSGVCGPRHRPADPETLFLLASRCVATAEGGFRGAVMQRLAPLGARRSPWEHLLKRSGR